jgi:hypothetical protein
VITELRIYTLRDGAMDDFMRVWRDQVVPLRRRHGFTVAGGWIDRRTNRFAWVVSHEAPDGWDAAMAPYAAARPGSLDPDPAVFIESMDAAFVEPA